MRTIVRNYSFDENALDLIVKALSDPLNFKYLKLGYVIIHCFKNQGFTYESLAEKIIDLKERQVSGETCEHSLENDMFENTLNGVIEYLNKAAEEKLRSCGQDFPVNVINTLVNTFGTSIFVPVFEWIDDKFVLKVLTSGYASIGGY